MQQIVIAHGVDSRSPYYAQPLIDNLEKMLHGVPHTITSLYMGDVFEAELEAWNKQRATNPLTSKLKAKSERTWFHQFVGDQYQFANWRNAIIDQCKAVNLSLPVHLVAHSWGCIFAYENLVPYISANDGKCVSVTLHGSPLDLYRLHEGAGRFAFEMPTDNFFHPMDFIAEPMGHASNVTDHVIVDAGPSIDLFDNISALMLIHETHGAGWRSKALAQCVANKVIAEAAK